MTIVFIQFHGLFRIMGYIGTERSGPRTQNLRLQITGTPVSTPTGPVEQTVGFGAVMMDTTFAGHEHFGEIVAARGVSHRAVHQDFVRRLVAGRSETNISIEIRGIFMATLK